LSRSGTDRLGLGQMMLDFQNFSTTRLFLNWPLRFLNNPFLMLTNYLFSLEMACDDFSMLLISTGWSPEVAEVAPDVIGRRLVQLFHYTETGSFFLLYSLWEVESATVMGILLQIEVHTPTIGNLKPANVNTSLLPNKK
jgi:hypothetical protein